MKPGGHEFVSHSLLKRLSHVLWLKGGTFAKGLAADIGTRPMIYLFEHRGLFVVGSEMMGRCNAESVSQ